MKWAAETNTSFLTKSSSTLAYQRPAETKRNPSLTTTLEPTDSDCAWSLVCALSTSRGGKKLLIRGRRNQSPDTTERDRRLPCFQTHMAPLKSFDAILEAVEADISSNHFRTRRVLVNFEKQNLQAEERKQGSSFAPDPSMSINQDVFNLLENLRLCPSSSYDPQ